MSYAEVDYWSRVAGLEALVGGSRAAAVRSVQRSFPAIRGEVPPVEWRKALLAASLVTEDAPERVLERALRIANGCIQDEDAPDDAHEGARIVLERIGNARSVALAESKGLLSVSGLLHYGPLSLDVLHYRRALEVVTHAGTVSLNPFQRDVWAAASSAPWLSISAPTSAGKSHIFRLWLREQLSVSCGYTAAYIVPTRALIEEVGRQLSEELVGLAEVYSIPWSGEATNGAHRVFVFTQERLHLLQQNEPGLRLDMIIIDEAQKFGDGSRGVLLQRVLDEAVRSSPNLQVIFASPLTSNPEMLLDGASGRGEAITSELVTVSQNLIYANQVRGKPMLWNAEVFLDAETHAVGQFSLPARPQPAAKRLSLVALALGKDASANVVYVNGASDAEKIAGHIADGMPAAASLDEELGHLAELVSRTIHPRFQLVSHLKSGVAFHYGNMPLLVRESIEALFRSGAIKYLVCTSTLLEGVNLPCQNLFVSGPRKGRGNVMSLGDFWNLAGRAGRWGLEFQGNVVCVDTADEVKWPVVPSTRVRAPIRRATSLDAEGTEALIRYIEAGTPVDASREAPTLEAITSLLAVHVLRGEELGGLAWLHQDPPSVARIQIALETQLATVTLDPSIIERHAGISPMSMQRLADEFSRRGPRDELMVAAPESDDAVEHLVSAIGLVDEFLGGQFSSHSGRQFQLALLLARWMRGLPLAVLIQDRIRYGKRAGRDEKLPALIRAVMTDVEQIARFQAPLYLSCYVDVLAQVHPSLFDTGDQGSAGQPDIALMLELGVSRATEVAAMSLGLSRTTAVALSDFILADSLSPRECLDWLTDHDLEALGLPVLVLREVGKVLGRHRGGQTSARGASSGA